MQQGDASDDVCAEFQAPCLQIPDIARQSPDTWGILWRWVEAQPHDLLFRPADLYMASVKAQRESVQASLRTWARAACSEQDIPIEEEMSVNP